MIKQIVKKIIYRERSSGNAYIDYCRGGQQLVKM